MIANSTFTDVINKFIADADFKMMFAYENGKPALTIFSDDGKPVLTIGSNRKKSHKIEDIRKSSIAEVMVAIDDVTGVARDTVRSRLIDKFQQYKLVLESETVIFFVNNGRGYIASSSFGSTAAILDQNDGVRRYMDMIESKCGGNWSLLEII